MLKKVTAFTLLLQLSLSAIDPLSDGIVNYPASEYALIDWSYFTTATLGNQEQYYTVTLNTIPGNSTYCPEMHM
jgi:hypothetical protein